MVPTSGHNGWFNWASGWIVAWENCYRFFLLGLTNKVVVDWLTCKLGSYWFSCSRHYVRVVVTRWLHWTGFRSLNKWFPGLAGVFTILVQSTDFVRTDINLIFHLCLKLLTLSVARFRSYSDNFSCLWRLELLSVSIVILDFYVMD